MCSRPALPWRGVEVPEVGGRGVLVLRARSRMTISSDREERREEGVLSDGFGLLDVEDGAPLLEYPPKNNISN